MEFLDQTKRMFREMQNVEALVQSEYVPSSFNNETCDLSGLFASLISSGNTYNSNLISRHGNNCDELGRALSSIDRTQSSPFMSDVHQTTMASTCRDSSHSDDQCQSFGRGAQVLLSNESSTQFQHVLLQSSYPVSNLATETPCISTWSSEGSVLTSHEPQLPSKMRVQDSLDVLPTEHGFVTDLSKCYMVDSLSELFSPSPEHGMNGMAMTLNNHLSQSKGPSLLSSGLIEGNIPVMYPGNPVQNSTTNTLNCDGQEKPGSFHCAEYDLFDGLGLDFGFTLPGECWEDIVTPILNDSHTTINDSVSECISGLGGGSTPGPRNSLFSELGIEELLNGIGNSSSVTKPSLEDQSSTSKRRRAEGSSVDDNQVRLATVSYSSSMNSMQPVYNMDKTNNLAQPKMPEEPTRGTRKRARLGENTRPRPKDRQQIQDRLKELRKIIPNGHKPSIDVLLDRTIKYMIFLQSVTKYADKLKQADEPKMIDQGNGVVLKDNSRGGGSGGVTWAFEVEGQTLVCPVVVEDLSSSGQMLIEMLCEDQGFFLEIADIIRGFGLNILKGVMELRETKIWARFIVEANKHVTRMDIFWSLIQLLQQTATSGIDSTNQHSNAVDGGILELKNSQQPPVRVASHQLGRDSSITISLWMRVSEVH